MKPTLQLIKGEFLASLVVFLVALPLCLGIAIASGVPPALGLITGIVGGLVTCALAGCPLQVSGPAAGLTVMVYEIVQEWGLEMLGPIVLLAGAIQLVAGLLRGGQWFRAIAPSIIYGMLAGIGILIFASQFHVMVDNHPRKNGWENLISIPETIYPGLWPLQWDKHHAAATVGLITISIMLFWHKIAPKSLKWLPSALIAVLVGSAIANFASFPVVYIEIPDQLLSAAIFPTSERLHSLGSVKIFLEALALAFVASAETLFSASAVERLRPGLKTKHDRELCAQGVGNMICGFLGSLPMTGVIVRSAANVNAGAKTRFSGVMHGLWLLLLVCFIPNVLELVPKACLAAILVYTGIKLINVESIRKLRSYGPLPFAVYLITMATIVIKDLLTGVVVGLALSLAKLIYALTHLGIKVSKGHGNRYDVHLSGAATFVRLPYLTDTLDAIPADAEVHVHFKRLNYIDHACMDALADWQKLRAKQGGVVVLEQEELMKMYNLKNTINPKSSASESWDEGNIPASR